MISEQEIIAGIIEREGAAFTDHPDDRGGPTKYGITLATLQWWRPGSTRHDLQQLSEDAAKECYAKLYIQPFNWMPPGRCKVFVIDCAVNHGMKNAVKFLQRALETSPDGNVGQATKHAMDYADQDELFIKLIKYRLKFYSEIVEKDKTQLKWLRGWINRVVGML